MRVRMASLLSYVIVSLPAGVRAETADGMVGRLHSMVEPVHDRTMRLTVHLRNASSAEDVLSMRGLPHRSRRPDAASELLRAMQNG